MHDQAQGERSAAQQEARGAPQGGLLLDPKEDANRVIEDILAVSHLPTQRTAYCHALLK